MKSKAPYPATRPQGRPPQIESPRYVGIFIPERTVIDVDRLAAARKVGRSAVIRDLVSAGLKQIARKGAFQ
jgi:hypothetical protein